MTLQELHRTIESTTRDDWYSYKDTYTLLSEAAIAIRFRLMDDTPELEYQDRKRFRQCGGYFCTSSFEVTYYGQAVAGCTVVLVGDISDYAVIPFRFYGENNAPMYVSSLEAHVSWLMSSEIDRKTYNELLRKANIHIQPYVGDTCMIEDRINPEFP